MKAKDVAGYGGKGDNLYGSHRDILDEGRRDLLALLRYIHTNTGFKAKSLAHAQLALDCIHKMTAIDHKEQR